MKKKIILIIFSVFMLNAYNLLSFTYKQSEDGHESDYVYVYIVCDEELCELVCFTPGEVPCTFQDAWGCEGCVEEGSLFDESQAQDMFDYANQQINQGNNSGSYNNNLYIEPTGPLYYRTVEWNNNPSIPHKDITVTITVPE